MKEIKYKGLIYTGFPENSSFWKNYLIGETKDKY